jgi:hypothetical protein
MCCDMCVRGTKNGVEIDGGRERGRDRGSEGVRGGKGYSKCVAKVSEPEGVQVCG